MSKPKWLTQPDGLSGRALTVWKSLAFPTYRRGYLTARNQESFRALCRCMALADAAWAEIERDGVVIGTSSGAKKSNPAVQAMVMAQREVERLEKEFGLGED